MVKKEVLHQFIEKGGYNIVRFKDGRWKNTVLASRKTGLSRMTIYAILKEHPKPPPKALPKYYEKLEESEGYKKLKEVYGKKPFWKDLVRRIREGFIFLGRKDPINWNEKDFVKLWEKWHSPYYGTIEQKHGLNFRRLMTILPKGLQYQKRFKTIQPKPLRVKWYLREEEMIAIIKVIERVDVLIFFLLGIFTGARKKAILTPIPAEIDFSQGTLSMYESKIKTWVIKYLPDSLLTLIERYIKDFHIPEHKKLMPYSDVYYYKAIKEAGKKAKVIKYVGVPPKPQGVSPHMLKHTFVQQCKEHGVPAEVAVQQAHTELRTLNKWYSFAVEEKIRKHMRGEEWKPEPFTDFIDRIVAHATRRYEQIS